MITAMHDYGLDLTLPRMAAFIATVMHETDLFRTFIQPIDNGTGSIHLIPANQIVACENIPLMSVLLQATSCPPGSADACICNPDALMTMVESTRFAFVTGAWYIAQGAQIILGPSHGCYDLLSVADSGIGSVDQSCLTNPPSSIYPAACQLSGFYFISYCVFGSLDDVGLNQRIFYYKVARAVLLRAQIGLDLTTPLTQEELNGIVVNTPQSVPNTGSGSSGGGGASTSKSLDSGIIFGIIIGCVAATVCVFCCAVRCMKTGATTVPREKGTVRSESLEKLEKQPRSHEPRGSSKIAIPKTRSQAVAPSEKRQKKQQDLMYAFPKQLQDSILSLESKLRAWRQPSREPERANSPHRPHDKKEIGRIAPKGNKKSSNRPHSRPTQRKQQEIALKDITLDAIPGQKQKSKVYGVGNDVDQSSDGEMYYV